MMLIVILAAIIALLSRSGDGGFGLLPSSSIESTPVLALLPTEILKSEPVLQLRFASPIHLDGDAATVVGTATAPNVPVDVHDAAAMNTRLGGEIALFWKNPVGNHDITIARQEGNWNPLLPGVVLVEHLAAESFMDTTAVDGTHYSYLIQTAAINTESTILSSGVVVNAVASDTTPPAAPRNLTVQSSQSGLMLTWEQPAEEDVAKIQIYRALMDHAKGEGESRVLLAEVPVVMTQYEDSNVIPNATYSYTLVVVDTAGNVSSTTNPAPRMGNSLPFAPL